LKLALGVMLADVGMDAFADGKGKPPEEPAASVMTAVPDAEKIPVPAGSDAFILRVARLADAGTITGVGGMAFEAPVPAINDVELAVKKTAVPTDPGSEPFRLSEGARLAEAGGAAPKEPSAEYTDASPLVENISVPAVGSDPVLFMVTGRGL
jgi:hypothetical protein